MAAVRFLVEWKLHTDVRPRLYSMKEELRSVRRRHMPVRLAHISR